MSLQLKVNAYFDDAFDSDDARDTLADIIELDFDFDCEVYDEKIADNWESWEMIIDTSATSDSDAYIVRNELQHFLENTFGVRTTVELL